MPQKPAQKAKKPRAPRKKRPPPQATSRVTRSAKRNLPVEEHAPSAAFPTDTKRRRVSMEERRGEEGSVRTQTSSVVAVVSENRGEEAGLAQAGVAVRTAGPSSAHSR